MKSSTQQDLIVAMVHISIAKSYLENVTHEVKCETKRWLNTLINRLQANENDVLCRLGDSQSAKEFKKQIMEADGLFFSHIIIRLLEMNNEQRDLVERIIDGVAKGEIFEFEAEKK